MISVILQIATRYIVPLQLLLSVFLLLRGHNQPGGGFIGGLTAAGAFALYVVACDIRTARQKLGINPQILAAFGLLIALISAFLPLLFDKPLLTGMWDGSLPLQWLGLGDLKLGTPLLFDVGVYLVVIGITLQIVFTLAEED